VSDLTAKEQDHVRAALRFLHVRCGTWRTLSKPLKSGWKTLALVASGTRPACASLAVRVARLAGVGVDDVLTGRYPLPGTCAHCGHRAAGGAEAAE
jgi:hypothetical protein